MSVAEGVTPDLVCVIEELFAELEATKNNPNQIDKLILACSHLLGHGLVSDAVALAELGCVQFMQHNGTTVLIQVSDASGHAPNNRVLMPFVNFCSCDVYIDDGCLFVFTVLESESQIMCAHVLCSLLCLHGVCEASVTDCSALQIQQLSTAMFARSKQMDSHNQTNAPQEQSAFWPLLP